jgi:tyrosine-protein kinase Etk/Wzc
MIEKKQTTDLRIIFINFMYHWPLFLIGMGIALAGLFCYIKLSRPQYQVMAALKVQDEKKSSDRPSGLKEIDLSNSAIIIENEMAVLQSNYLMTQVVEDLQLWLNIQQKDGFIYRDIYDGAAFTVQVINRPKMPVLGDLQVQLKDSKTYLLKLEDESVKEYAFGKPVKTSLGTIVLNLQQGVMPVKDEMLRIQFEDISKKALYYQQAIEITMPNKLANIIALSLKDALPQRGKDVLNKLIYNYQSGLSAAKRNEARKTVEFLNQRLQEVETGVINAEKEVENFRITNEVTDIASESKIGLENKQANTAQLNDIKVQLGAIGKIEEFLKSPRNAEKIPATTGITEPGLNNLVEKLTDLQLQRQRMLAVLPETNPDFDPLNRQIAATRQALRENVAGIKASLLQTASNLQTFNSGIASTIKSLPTQERQFLTVKRNQASKDALLTYLMQKREEAQLSYGATVEKVEVLEPPYTQPAKIPQKPLEMALSLLLGFLIPAGILFGRGLLKPRLTDLQQMKTIFGIPVLAELPFAAGETQLFRNGYRLSPIIDHLRAMRIKLGLAYGSKGRGRITLVTSSIPNEGKSFVSTNLASSLAMSGRRTVIVEMDMRRPKIANMIKISASHAGVSDFLAGSLRLVDVVQTIGLESNLDVITCGTIVQHSSELLEGSRLSVLLDQLKDLYDDIIIDSPPVHLVPDALVLSQFADITLYVVRQGVTGVQEVRFIKELHQQQQLKNMNLVFNGIMREKYGYGYSYGGAYNYNTSKRLSAFSNFGDRF